MNYAWKHLGDLGLTNEKVRKKTAKQILSLGNSAVILQAHVVAFFMVFVKSH